MKGEDIQLCNTKSTPVLVPFPFVTNASQFSDSWLIYFDIAINTDLFLVRLQQSQWYLSINFSETLSDAKE
jgi:hypothetical protein